MTPFRLKGVISYLGKERTEVCSENRLCLFIKYWTLYRCWRFRNKTHRGSAIKGLTE